MSSAAQQREYRQLREDRIEDVEFLLQYEGNAQSIVRRIGFVSVQHATNYLRRHGRPDLARKLGTLGAPGDPYDDKSTRHREKAFQ